MITPVELAALILSAAGPGVDPLEPVLGPARAVRDAARADRPAVDRTTRLRRQRQRAAGRVHPPDRPAQGAPGRAPRTTRGGRRGSRSQRPTSSASSPRSTACTSEMLAEAGARDAGDLIRDALRVVRDRPGAARRFEHVLVDDAHDLDLASATLTREVGRVAADRGGRPARGVRGREPRRVRGRDHARAEPARPAPGAARRHGRGGMRVRADGGRGRESRSGDARTSAPRRSRWPPTSSG